jgi:hypothetical protein
VIDKRRVRKDRVHEPGADFWPLAMTRELDDLILWLRANERAVPAEVPVIRRCRPRTSTCARQWMWA